MLPFHNGRGDPSLDYIVDGITESLIIDIFRALPGNFVGYVLDESVLLDKDLARVNAELIYILTDGQLWSDRFDKERSHVLAAQDEIVAL